MTILEDNQYRLLWRRAADSETPRTGIFAEGVVRRSIYRLAGGSERICVSCRSRRATILKPRWNLRPQVDRRRSAEVNPYHDGDLVVASL
jgi:hypothetical protein